VDPSSIARESFEARLWLRCLNLGLELDPIVALAHCRWQRSEAWPVRARSVDRWLPQFAECVVK